MVFENQRALSSLSSVYPASFVEELIQDARERANAAVEIATEILRRSGMKIISDPAAPIGEPRGAILDAAESWQADMMVLGSHGRRGLDRHLMGSVSEAVAVHARCSVEVIRRA